MRQIVHLAATAMLCASAHGAPFGDPTRPPGQVEGAGDAGADSAIRVESILIAPDRRIAIVNGREVTIGSQVGDARVVRISESEIVIRSAQGDETLKLFAPVVRRSPQKRVEK
jgi:MSHA biogenesis protein MshK